MMKHIVAYFDHKRIISEKSFLPGDFVIDPRNGPGLDPSDDICFVPALNPPVPEKRKRDLLLTFSFSFN